MTKKTPFLAVAVLATGMLTACGAGTNDEFGNNNDNDTRPIGYYSNDRDVGFRDVNNDGTKGPLTDMMDNDNDDNNRNGLDYMNNDNNTRNNTMNNTNTNNIKDDTNRNDNFGNGTANYPDGYDGELADRIEHRVEKIKNVKDAHVLVTNDTVLVGVDMNNKNNNNIESDVKKTVKKVTNKQVKVVDDEDTFNRIGDITNDLQNGKAYNEVQSDVTNILDDLGDAVKRPFENNR